MNVTQEDFFHDDAVGAQAIGDGLRGFRAKLVALRGEDFAHDVVGREIAKRRRHHGRDDFGVHRLRQIRVDIAKPLGIEAVAHGNGKADRQAFARLNGEDFALAGRVRRCRRGEQVVAKIIHGHALYQRYD